MNVAAFGPVSQNIGFATQNRIFTNRNQISANRYCPTFDGGVATKLRSKQSQIETIKRVAAEKHNRRRPDQCFDHPEAIISQAPDRETFFFPATNKQPFCKDRKARHPEKAGTSQNHAAEIKLQRLIKFDIDPVEALVEKQQTDIAVDCIKCELGCAARPICKIGCLMGEASFSDRCNRLLWQMKMLRKTGD
ncbi:hypothetical protein FQZ97_1040320 [compost metagenome]